MSGTSGLSGANPSYHEHRAHVREHAVRDVLDGGMSMIGAAVLWNLRVADLELALEIAIAERNADTEGTS